MMKAILCKGIFLLCLAGLLTGCNTEVKRIAKNDIQFDSLFVEKTYHFFDVETNPVCSLQINFVYPANYADKDILKQIQQQFVSDFFGEQYATLSLEDAVETYTNNFIKTCEEMESNFKIEMENHDMEMDEMWYVHEESATDTIVFNCNDLLSFVVSKEYYLGGAHGGHNYVNRVIDLKTGQRITEAIIFTDDYQDDLTKIIIDAIALSNNVEISELENIGFFNLDEIVPNNNFYIDDTGITYIYNEYEIAAYVVGPVLVQIPYDKIRHLLRVESPVSGLAFR
jgi:hypothetical protein